MRAPDNNAYEAMAHAMRTCFAMLQRASLEDGGTQGFCLSKSLQGMADHVFMVRQLSSPLLLSAFLLFPSPLLPSPSLRLPSPDDEIPPVEAQVARVTAVSSGPSRAGQARHLVAREHSTHARGSSQNRCSPAEDAAQLVQCRTEAGDPSHPIHASTLDSRKSSGDIATRMRTLS